MPISPVRYAIALLSLCAMEPSLATPGHRVRPGRVARVPQGGTARPRGVRFRRVADAGCTLGVPGYAGREQVGVERVPYVCPHRSQTARRRMVPVLGHAPHGNRAQEQLPASRFA
jgi:hypothetical protein